MHRIPEFGRGLLNEVAVVLCRYTRWFFLLLSNLLQVYQRVKSFYYTKNYLIHAMSGAKGAVAVLDTDWGSESAAAGAAFWEPVHGRVLRWWRDGAGVDADASGGSDTLAAMFVVSSLA